MISAELIGHITAIQTGYFGVLEALLDVETRTVKPETSFARIHSTSQEARESFDRLVELALSPGMQQTPVPEFRCAIIGSSNHGKTSVLVEMFPDLAERGLLITDVKDTTSQALVIKSGTRSDMVFRPWTLDQIRYLVDISRDELSRRHIEVQYREDHVEVDGSEADFESNVKSKFKFGIRQKLKPFAGTYGLDAAKPENSGLVARLTTKVDYSQAPRPQDIVVNDEAFNDLQFRVAVRSVEMGSDFSEIGRWLGSSESEKTFADNLTFIDTPGLKAGGSDSDEVLRHVLAKKNQQIAVELLKHDELDLIVHLVLCGQQSDFASLWSHLEGVDSEILQDLGDRIIVAVNGFNVYFDNPDLSRRWKGGDGAGDDDHFNVSVQHPGQDERARSSRSAEHLFSRRAAGDRESGRELRGLLSRAEGRRRVMGRAKRSRLHDVTTFGHPRPLQGEPRGNLRSSGLRQGISRAADCRGVEEPRAKVDGSAIRRS